MPLTRNRAERAVERPMPADRIFCAVVRSQLFISSPHMPRLLSAQRDENGIREASVCQTNAKRRLDEVLTNATVWSLFDPSGVCLLGTNSRRRATRTSPPSPRHRPAHSTTRAVESRHSRLPASPVTARHGHTDTRTHVRTYAGTHVRTYAGAHIQPFSQKSRIPTVAKECQTGLYDPAEADLELFRNSWSAGFSGERLYAGIADRPILADPNRNTSTRTRVRSTD